MIGAASDPVRRRAPHPAGLPDVITLDVEMPRMDGITFLRKLMAQHPIPVVMCSSLDRKRFRHADAGTRGWRRRRRAEADGRHQAGAHGDRRVRICDAVKGAAKANLKRLPGGAQASRRRAGTRRPRSSPPTRCLPPPVARHAMARTTETIVCIGASTGGTESLRVVLEALPLDCPGIVIVQHMPEKFTEAFAQPAQRPVPGRGQGSRRRRRRAARARAHRARQPAHAAPSEWCRYYVTVKDGPLVSRHRPSVDVLFRSAAQYAGSNAAGIIMTGMGDDGARGLLEMKTAGARTIAQDEATSVVFGMPREAIERGAADKVLPLDMLAAQIVQEGRR